MEKICNLDSCTSCRACMQICPKNAIDMKENEFGVLLPFINQEKCINCGLCKKVCQANGLESMNVPRKCYAVWTKYGEDRQYCSSGGISTGFARNIIDEEGIVFGAAYEDNFTLNIVEATTCEEIKKFRGSKYVQCDTADSYKRVQKYLENSKKVLYVGTPCQIMGLRKFLRRDYEGLITVDIICHGVPPFKHLVEHTKHICPNRKISKVTFRGEHDFKLTVYNNGQILYSNEKYKDAYFTAFYEGLNCRENCYECKFAKEERGSDITIGDFWGINRDTLKRKYKGKISAVLINTQKGENFFNNVKESFYYEERCVEEAVKGNTQLRQPTRRHEQRDAFIEAYFSEGLEKAYEKAGIYNILEKAAHDNSVLKRFMRKISRLCHTKKIM